MDAIVIRNDKKGLIKVMIASFAFGCLGLLIMYYAWKANDLSVILFVFSLIPVCISVLLIIFLFKKYTAIKYVLKADQSGINIQGCLVHRHNLLQERKFLLYQGEVLMYQVYSKRNYRYHL